MEQLQKSKEIKTEMKVVKYPIIILLYIFSMYFILNWFVWNWPFAGKEVGLLFISGLLFFTGLGLLFKNRKSKEKSFVILLSFIVVIFSPQDRGSMKKYEKPELPKDCQHWLKHSRYAIFQVLRLNQH